MTDSIHEVSIYNQRFLLLLGLLIVATFIIPLYFYSFIPSIGLFLSGLYLWWYLPSLFGFLPLFTFKLIYHRNLTRSLWLFFTSTPFLGFIVFTLDFSKMPITPIFFHIFYETLQKLYSVWGIIGGGLLITFLGYMYKLTTDKVYIRVPEIFRWKFFIIGYSRPFYQSQDLYKDGFPIEVINKTNSPITISFIFFILKNNEEKRERITLPKHIRINSQENKPISIPWEDTLEACYKIIMLQRKEDKYLPCTIALWDDFKGELIEGPEIQVNFIVGTKASMDFWDNIGKTK